MIWAVQKLCLSSIYVIPDRWIGVVTPKQWMKLLQGYTREKKQHCGVNKPWHMHFLIKYVTINNIAIVLKIGLACFQSETLETSLTTCPVIA